MTADLRAELRRELDVLERVQADLAAVAAREDDRRRHDLVKLRRALASQIAVVGRLGEALFAGGVDITHAKYRRLFSEMRSKTALHQANWPAVRLGESPEEYTRSALGVREANGVFVAWMRTTLAAPTGQTSGT